MIKTKNFIIVLLIFIFLYKNVFSSFYFSEVMPFTENDVTDEYIQITYDGNGINNLNGYKLSDKSGKEYIFGEDLFLPDETKKYYRPQTMILLNNSDEEIYLKDDSGTLVDSFYYTISKKGEAIKIESDNNLLDDITENTEINSGEIEEESSSGSLEENEIIENNQDLNENETETGSGEINQEENLSNSGSLEENEIETGTGIIDEGTEQTNENLQLEITGSGIIQENSSNPLIEKISIDIKNTFQSPTYLLEKDTSIRDGFIYNCDRTKDDCRVNFDFRPTFSSLKESDFNCKTDFGLGAITGEENKCNPNTIIFPLGTTNIKINISHKTNQNHSSEINIKIKNEGKQVLSSTSNSTTIIYTNPSESNIIKTKLDIITPKIELQSGLEKDNTCNKKECKINFLYEKTHKDLVCNWDFGEYIDGNGNGNENKCNPSYVYFGPGKHEVFLEVCDKNNDDNCKKSSFILENKYSILEPKAIITLQGKLSKNKILDDNKITCFGSDNCSINFDGSGSIGEELTYFWDFGNGEYFEGKNPKSIIFQTGNHQVVFEVYDEYGNYSQDFFEIEVVGKQNDILEAKEKDSENEDQTLSSLQEKQINLLKIELQGKLGSNKILQENKIICIKTCSINFDGSNSVGDFASYFWDFGNGETYVGKNPPYVSYKDFGKYSVLLSGETKTGELIEKEFFIEYYNTLPKEQKDLNGNVVSANLNIEEKDEDDYYENDFYEQEIIDEGYNKDLIITIFIFIFLSFILGLFILKKYKLI
ncbi:hypothetical protein HUU51_04925 [Candidatus Gracilibacteria bacterium]|nr:hypothetical protein [Candidatus Gracilibacteria bacterium]